MELVLNKKNAGLLAGLLVLAGIAWAVKHLAFPPLNDKFMQLDFTRLRQAPSGVFVFRPSQFAGSQRFGVIAVQAGNSDSPTLRLLGHNATAKEILALAFGARQSRILMPANTPTNRYDFLATVPDSSRRLQKAILDRLDCTAAWDENQETEVLELRVRGFTAQGVHPDGPGKFDYQFTGDNNLHWTHARMAWFADRIEELFGKPVVDKTGLNDFYEFSFAWNWRGNYTDADRVALTNSINDLGFKLESDTDAVKMLVVKKNR